MRLTLKLTESVQVIILKVADAVAYLAQQSDND